MDEHWIRLGGFGDFFYAIRVQFQLEKRCIPVSTGNSMGVVEMAKEWTKVTKIAYSFK